MIKVYLADDHLIVRDGLRALLEANPNIVVVGDAPDGHRAVQEVLHLQPDVVIMDISMPILNGIAATQDILAVLPETRVIILSMLGDAEHVFRALDAGAQGYLLKESAGREVVDAVLEVTTGRVYLSPPVTSTLITDYLHTRGQVKPEDPFALLSLREREVLKLVVAGNTSAQIAEVLFLSPKTVESYRSRIMHKLGAPDIPSLVKLVIQHGPLD